MNQAHVPPFFDLGGIYLLDTHHQGKTGIIGSYLVPHTRGEQFLLIECGSGATLGVLEQAISQAGFDPAALSDVLVTHIHLDHAGAAGALATRFGANVYVHEQGAPHLADPSRLWSSASRIYGDAMQTLWGEMLPVPENQLKSVTDGNSIQVGGHTLQVIHSPGHAGSHVVYQLDSDLFTGDAAAIAMGDAGDTATVVRPAVPPPEVDLEIWRDTVIKLKAARASRLLLTHFGAITAVDAHLEAITTENARWADTILAGMQQGADDDALAARLRLVAAETYQRAQLDQATINRYNMTSNDAMSVMGLKRYWKKHHPERLEAS
jgi:glyoxylase-like metal-dependent hydrolase (beta-lactamase superfamily II)